METTNEDLKNKFNQDFNKEFDSNNDKYTYTEILLANFYKDYKYTEESTIEDCIEFATNPNIEVLSANDILDNKREYLRDELEESLRGNFHKDEFFPYINEIVEDSFEYSDAADYTDGEYYYYDNTDYDIVNDDA